MTKINAPKGIHSSLIQAANFSSDIFIFFSPSGKILFYNHMAANAFALPIFKNTVATSFEDLFSNSTQYFEHELWNKVSTQGALTLSLSPKVSELHGSENKLDMKFSFCLVGEDEPVLMGISRELERKYLLKSDLLRESNEKFKEAQALGKIGDWHFDLATNKITWSDQMFEIFPESKELGEPTFERHQSTIHHEDVANWKDTVSKCLNDGKPYEMTFRTVHPEGKIVWVKAKGKALFSVSGEMVALFGTCQDISHEVVPRMEKDFVLSKMNVGIWRLNIGTSEITWDKGMRRLFGVKENEKLDIRQLWRESVSRSAQEQIHREVALALENKKDFDMTYEVCLPSGQHKFLYSRARVERNENGEALCIYGITYDRTGEVTLNRRLEDEKIKMIHSAKLATLGELAAGIAHDINNPLTVISGSSSIISHAQITKTPKLVLDNVKRIQDAVDRISKIIGVLGRFSRQSDGRELSRFSARSIIQESIELSLTMARRKQVKLLTQDFEDFDVTCDVIQIQQILLNLINNGVEANARRSGAFVELYARKTKDGVLFVVKDSGEGIEENLAAQIFTPFFTTKGSGKGTGLGLSICKRIAREQGGEISYQVVEGRTAFILSLPKSVCEKTSMSIAH